ISSTPHNEPAVSIARGVPPTDLQGIDGSLLFNRQRRLATLASLLRFNRYVVMVTIPFLYCDPLWFSFNSHNLQSKHRLTMTRTLLGSVPSTRLSKIVSIKLDLKPADNEPSSSPLNYLGHLLHITRNCGRPADDQVAHMEGEVFESMCAVDRMHPACLASFHNKTDLAWYFYQVILYRETIWSLVAPIPDQLESLTIALSNIRRYHEVINRFGRPESIDFILDELFD
ncbi:hypothetical protein BGX33_006160, partial [Mortierella sp. NVP41]